MKFTTKFLALGILSISMSLVSCSDDDDNTTGIVDEVKPMTIAEFAIENPNYSSLVAALTATDLVKTVSDPNANLTVFAPNNDAFERFLTAAGFTNGLSDVDTDEEKALVKNILLNHVIGRELKAATIISSAPDYEKNLAEGPKDLAESTTNISTFYNVIEGKVFVNGNVEVVTPDAFDATNGIVHAVKEVIALPKISTFAIADTRVSSLKEALIARELVETVDGLNPATVFAPLNDAFIAIKPLPEGDDLSNMLTYHVIPGINAVSTNVLGLVGKETPATVQGQTISVVEGPAIKGNMNTENSSLIITDIQASNGVIHVIDRVLLPSE